MADLNDNRLTFLLIQFYYSDVSSVRLTDLRLALDYKHINLIRCL